MKKIIQYLIPCVCVLMFFAGIAIILTSNTGVLTSRMEAANLAGAILSIFSGIYLAIILFSFLKKK